MRPLLAAPALVLLAAVPTAGQPAAPSPTHPSAAAAADDPIDRTLDRAFELIERHEPARAEHLLKPITARSNLTSRQRARALRATGQAAYVLGQPARAAEAFERALAAAEAASDRREAGWARRWAGTVHYGAGRLDEARELWNAALDDFAATGDTLGQFETLDDLAVATPGLARRPFLERALDIASDRRDPLLEARARVRWAQALLVGARPGPALVELERAVALLRPRGARGNAALGDALGTLAWALRAHGSNERAVAVQREGLQLASEARDIDGQLWGYYGLGTALVELRRFDEADAAMRRARALAAQTGSQTAIRLVADSEGWVAMKRGDWTRAVPALEASLEQRGIDLSAMAFVNLAQAYRHVGRYTEALKTATGGVDVARRLGLEDNELQALTEVAEAQAALGERAAADATLQGVVERLERYRAALAPSDFLKQGFTDRFTHAYGLLVRVLMDDARPAEALAAAERVRARAFADLLLARRLRERDEADTGRWLLGADVDAGTSGTVPNSGTVPGVVDSPATASPLDAAGLAALARRLDTTIVSYWIHDAGSYAWVVGPDGTLRGTSLSIDPGRLAREIRRAIDVPPEVELNGASATTSPVDSNRRLYRWLWAPVAAWLPSSEGSRVTIIPHGPLFACPFAALRDPAGRYVIERHALHYAGSGAVLLEAVERTTRSPSQRGRALIVADPSAVSASGTGTLAALPAARREARAIEATLQMPSDVLLGGRASEGAVRRLLPAAAVAHFATHAIVTDRDPLGSHLVLAGSESGGPAHDGRLTASELAAMETAADLVVLGACRSARGPVSSDGIAGLTRAVMAAGAPSVIATLWDVTDEPTARLMMRFYREYAARRPKDEALRAAQLAVLADLRAGRLTAKVGTSEVRYPEHPWLWAAPILVGAP